MSDSADRLESDVEASRERLDRTLSGLQSRLSGDRLARDWSGLRQTGLSAQAEAERLLASARADPVPAVLICAGLGLLVYEALRIAAERRRLAVAPAPSAPDRHLPENRPDRLHDRLDDALEESFPGSDPVSVHITK